MDILLSGALFGALMVYWLRYQHTKKPEHWIHDLHPWLIKPAYVGVYLFWSINAMVIYTLGPYLVVALLVYISFRFMPAPPTK